MINSFAADAHELTSLCNSAMPGSGATEFAHTSPLEARQPPQCARSEGREPIPIFRRRFSNRRGPRGQAKAIQDLADRFGRVDDRNDSHPGAAAITNQRIDEE